MLAPGHDTLAANEFGLNAELQMRKIINDARRSAVGTLGIRQRLPALDAVQPSSPQKPDDRNKHALIRTSITNHLKMQRDSARECIYLTALETKHGLPQHNGSY